MTVKERLIEFIKFKNLSQSRFEKSVKLANGYVNNIRRSISPDKLQNIALYYPELNTSWLLTGEGDMINKRQELTTNTGVVTVSAEAWEIIKKQADSLATKDQQITEFISLLKKGNAHSDNVTCADASGSDLEE